jgi:hypothetical protein
MATNNLPQSTLDTSRPISASAVHVLARLAAKKAVTEQFRAEGRRVTLIPPAEINAKTREYLALHSGYMTKLGCVRSDLVCTRSPSAALLSKQITPKPQLKTLGFFYNQTAI